MQGYGEKRIEWERLYRYEDRLGRRCIAKSPIGQGMAYLSLADDPLSGQSPVMAIFEMAKEALFQKLKDEVNEQGTMSISMNRGAAS